jgi:hypothetical protein
MNPLVPAGPAPYRRLHPGQAVHVNAHAGWIPATVTSIGHTRVGLAYPPGTPAPFAGPVSPWVVRPADGVGLRRVRDLRPGDRVLAFDGTVHEVVNPAWPCRDGWWVVGYTTGEHTAVPAHTILRVLQRTDT